MGQTRQHKSDGLGLFRCTECFWRLCRSRYEAGLFLFCFFSLFLTTGMEKTLQEFSAMRWGMMRLSRQQVS